MGLEVAAAAAALGPAVWEKVAACASFSVSVGIGVEGEASKGEGGGERGADARYKCVEGGVELGEGFFGGGGGFCRARGVVRREKGQWICGRFG